MTRALIHLGFHKTGTSSAQHFLADNRHILTPHLQIVLMSVLGQADKAARRFSISRDAASLVEFAGAFHASIARAALDPRQPLLLSCEGLAGNIPGRAGVHDYSAVVELAPIIADVLGDQGFGGAALHFSLRHPDAWLNSAYRHNLRSTKLDMDYDTYAETFRRSADLTAIVDRVRVACPGNPVTTSTLEQSQTARFGPASPLLDPFDLAEATLARLDRPKFVNPAMPDQLIEQFRDLNRGPLIAEALKAAKAKLLAGMGAGPDEKDGQRGTTE